MTTTLLIDALIAAVKTIDRACTAVERNVRLRVNPPEPVVDAQPTGAGSGCAASAGPGGHLVNPNDVLTSDLLTVARAFIPLDHPLMPVYRDRAAQFAAFND